MHEYQYVGQIDAKDRYAQQCQSGAAETRRFMLHCWLDQANYINALAVSVLPFFEPTKPITLGELFVTLGELFLTLGESISLFFVYLQCNVRWRILLMLDQISTVLAQKNDELSLVLKLNRLACILKHGAPPTAKVTLGRFSLDFVNRQIYIGYLHT
jgi:hypothetical protein